MGTQNNTPDENATDLLSSIYRIQIRNEERISESDRLFCERQQSSLYHTLDEISRWYGIFVKEADKYKNSHCIKYLPNGKIKKHDPYNNRYGYIRDDYAEFEFKPFDIINKLAENNHQAISAFAKSIVAYFNNGYSISVPYPEIDKEKLVMGFHPVYQSYVDMVIEHLGGKSFREMAEEELVSRFLSVVKPCCWSKVKPELKRDKITFPNVISFDTIWTNRNKLHYDYHKDLDDFCAGIAFGADGCLQGGQSIIIRFDDNNIDVSMPYGLTTGNAEEMKFFKNGRIDVIFKDAKTAGLCFHKLKLDTI